MKFFIPKTSTPDESVKIHDAAKRWCEEKTGWPIESRSIYAIRYRHDGREYLAQVGESDNTEGLIICIFETSPAFLVCTTNRGVFSGDPIIVSRSDVSDLDYFEP